MSKVENSCTCGCKVWEAHDLVGGVWIMRSNDVGMHCENNPAIVSPVDDNFGWFINGVRVDENVHNMNDPHYKADRKAFAQINRYR